MRFVLIFGLLGIIVTVLAAQQAQRAAGFGWLVVAIEADFALGFVALATLYGLRSAGKSIEEFACRHGSSQVLRVVLLPYLIVGGVALYVGRWFDRDGLLNLVAPGMFVGRLPFPPERIQIKEAGVGAVLNLCWEFPNLSKLDREPGLLVGRVPILDGATPTARQFDEAVGWVAARRSEGRCVLIHCAQGHGRTATIGAAILVQLGLAADAEAALAMILAARPGASPARDQKAALIAYLASRRRG